MRLETPWLAAARTARNARRLRRRLGHPTELVRKYALGRSFVDIGAMWERHAEVAFLAEDVGATKVTAVDVTPATAEYEAERARRGSEMRFIQGDLHAQETIREVGKHEVAWCSGVLYHTPNPYDTVTQLREYTSDVLIVVTAIMPEVPGVAQACVFYPGLPEPRRLAHDNAHRAISAGKSRDAARVGLTNPFDPDQWWDNWWWGISPSALRAMLTTAGFDVVEVQHNNFHARAVARLR